MAHELTGTVSGDIESIDSEMTLSKFNRLTPRDFGDDWGTLKPILEGYVRDEFTPDGVRREATAIAEMAATNLKSLGTMLAKYQRDEIAVELTLREMTELIDVMTRLRRILVEVGIDQGLINLPRAADAVGMTKAGISKWRDDPLVNASWG